MTLRMPAEEYEAVRALAFATEASINDTVLNAVREYLSAEGRQAQIKEAFEQAVSRYSVALEKLADL